MVKRNEEEERKQKEEQVAARKRKHEDQQAWECEWFSSTAGFVAQVSHQSTAVDCPSSFSYSSSPTARTMMLTHMYPRGSFGFDLYTYSLDTLQRDATSVWTTGAASTATPPPRKPRKLRRISTFWVSSRCRDIDMHVCTIIPFK
jgi:hypothetical protein